MNCQTRKRLLVWAVPAAILLTHSTALAQETVPAPAGPLTGAEAAPAAEETFSQGVLFPYPLLSQALSGNMDKAGNINYLKLQKNPSLATFIRALASADVSLFPVHTIKTENPKNGKVTEKEDRSAELTFWINAYNAHLLKAVADAYPVKSPTEIKDLDTAKTRVVGGQSYSLKEVREKITKMDKRAYFALTDATNGGPRLPEGGVYWYASLDSGLNNAISTFVRSNRNVELNSIQKIATVSDFFKQADPVFKTGVNRDRYSGIRHLLANYSDGFNQKFFIAQHYDIRFVPVDKSLNDYTENSVLG